MDDLGGVAETATLAATTAKRAGSAHVLVVEDGSSRIVPLELGVLTIGRAPDLGLRLEHASVSRRHAEILVVDGEVRIVDLGSHNGTRVNGAPLQGSRVLTTGDVVAIGEVILVVHAELARRLPHVVLDEPSWRQRLAEEVERALQFGRALSVLAIAGGDVSARALRTIDVVGRSDGTLLALLPEAEPHVARDLAGVVLEAVRDTSPGVRVGIACCPSDATDADSLVMAARAAVQVARPGEVATVERAVERRRIGDSVVVMCHPTTIHVYNMLARLAKSKLTVLVVGDSGVGKEYAALAVHHHSDRTGRFVAVNCATIGGELAESELFGHVRGAFTGAVAAKTGYFEAADGGTLFLDEIGELSPAVQAKLLRALETRRFTPVGDTVERSVDVRVVAATHRDLDAEVAAGNFRLDLHQRIRGAEVHLPPLRERRCEIPILFREFVERFAREAGREPPVPTPAAVQQLLAHAWPGNVRELRNVAERVVAIVEDDRIEPGDLPFARPAPPPPPPAPAPRDPAGPMRAVAEEIEELERRRMLEALERSGGVKTVAARMIGMPIRTFNAKFRQYGL